MELSLVMVQGDLAFAEGKPKAAMRYFQAALPLAQKLDIAGNITVVFTKLGQYQFACGNRKAALRATTSATELHRQQGYIRLDGFSSQEVWWRHSQALFGNEKTEPAFQALQQAYDFLLTEIANLRDEGLRRNYMNKGAANRELLKEWVKQGRGQKILPQADCMPTSTSRRMFGNLSSACPIPDCA